MPWTLDNSGTQTCTIGTEHTLVSPTTNSVYVPQWRLNNAASGDIFELRVKVMTLSGGTLEQLWMGTFGGLPLDNKVIQAPPIASDVQCSFTIKQTAGTGRDVDWKDLQQGTCVLDSSGTTGSLTVGGADLVLASPTTNGTYVAQWRLNNQADGDVFEFRISTMTLSGGALEQMWMGPSSSLLVSKVFQSPPIPSDQQTRMSVKQTVGAGSKTVDWKFLRLS